MFLGVLVHKVRKSSYLKIIVAVETGYNVDLYTIRTRNYDIIEGIETGDQVLFSGEFKINNNSSYFILHYILKHSFSECPECSFPLTSNTCLINHDKEAQKLEGEWRVVHKRVQHGVIKVFFERANFVFAAVSLKKHWYNRIFKNLRNGDYIDIKGWRYKKKTTIKTISKK